MKADWLDLLEDHAPEHDSSMIRADTAEYDFVLVRGSDHEEGILDAISSVVHNSEELPDDAFSLGVLGVSGAAHRKALVAMDGPPTHQYFFFDIHGPLNLVEKHPDLRICLIVLDIYGEDGFDPERDHMTVVPGDALTDVLDKRGPYLEVSVHGPGQYDAPADEYVDDWSVLFARPDSAGTSPSEEH